MIATRTPVRKFDTTHSNRKTVAERGDVYAETTRAVVPFRKGDCSVRSSHDIRIDATIRTPAIVGDTLRPEDSVHRGVRIHATVERGVRIHGGVRIHRGVRIHGGVRIHRGVRIHGGVRIHTAARHTTGPGRGVRIHNTTSRGVRIHLTPRPGTGARRA